MAPAANTLGRPKMGRTGIGTVQSKDGRQAAVAMPRTPAREQTPCECCGTSEATRFGQKRGFTLWRCRECGVVYVSPQPTHEQLRALYAKNAGYYADANIDLSLVPPSSNAWLHELLERVGVPGKRLLDIGCANGQLMHHMAAFGWQVSGIDINPDAVAIARRNGLDAHPVSADDCDFPDGSFDAIHLGDVIEHVPSPKALLEQVRRLLRDGGVAVIRTPNNRNGFARLTSFLTRVTGFPWPQSEVPYHLFEFSEESLIQLLARSGLDHVHSESSGRCSFAYRVGATGCFDDLKRHFKKSRRSQWSASAIVSLPRLLAVAILLVPFYVLGGLLSDWSGQRDSLVVVARRRPARPE